MSAFRNKKIFAIFLIILLIGGYFGFKKIKEKEQKQRYVLTEVKKGTIISTVSGSGQILALDQIDIKPKISGEVLKIFVEKGKEVKAGDLILKLDDSDFQKAVNDAERSLETAKIELEKLLKPVDELSLLQAENSLAQAKEAKQRAQDNLEKVYQDGFNSVVNAFVDIPAVMAGLENILFGYDFNRNQWNLHYYTDMTKIYDQRAVQYFQDAYDSYQVAKKAYDQNFADYKLVNLYSEKEVIEKLIDETYETTKKISDATKNAQNLIQFYKDTLDKHNLKTEPLADNHLSLLISYIAKTNTHYLNLLSIKRVIKDSKESVLNAERLIKEKEEYLEKLKAGPEELDIRLKRILVQQKEDALKTAKENLAKCSIYAPFDGLISDIKVKKGDSVSSATVLANLISKQKIAEISLNEIDAAKVKVGQKATLTFDALPDVTLTGKVLEIDTVGTVSQGVVSYGVKIALDTDDERIKPSMSVTAEIVTNVKSDVFTLQNNAIKTRGNLKYVELIEASEKLKKQLKIGSQVTLPKGIQIKNQIVETGISNDTFTEIVSGLKEGDIVILTKVSPQTIQTPSSQTQFRFQIPGIGGGVPRR